MAPNDVLVNHPFPKEDLPLGSLICSLRSPTQDAHRAINLGQDGWSVAPLEDYSTYVEEGKQSLFETAVSMFLSLVWKSEKDEKIRVVASKAQKYTLLQPQKHFRQLCQNEGVRDWMRDNYGASNDGLFLVVGYLTMTDATVIKRGSAGSEAQVKVDANLPVIAAAATTPNGPRSQVTAHAGHNSFDSTVYKAKGEQIFSVCYRKLKFSWFKEGVAVDGTNRWKLFTSNRGSSKTAKPFVEPEISNEDFEPQAAVKILAGLRERYMILGQLAMNGAQEHWTTITEEKVI